MDLKELFDIINKYQLKLNPERFAFNVKINVAERIMKKAFELSQYKLIYKPKGSFKAQFLFDLMVVNSTNELGNDSVPIKILSADKALNFKGGRVVVVLGGLDNVLVKQSLYFSCKTTNNQEKYEALIANVKLTQEMGLVKLIVQSDSQLVTKYVLGNFQEKYPHLLR